MEQMVLMGRVGFCLHPRRFFAWPLSRAGTGMAEFILLIYSLRAHPGSRFIHTLLSRHHLLSVLSSEFRVPSSEFRVLSSEFLGRCPKPGKGTLSLWTPGDWFCAVRGLANRAKPIPQLEGCGGNHFPCLGLGQRPKIRIHIIHHREVPGVSTWSASFPVRFPGRGYRPRTDTACRSG